MPKKAKTPQVSTTTTMTTDEIRALMRATVRRGQAALARCPDANDFLREMVRLEAEEDLPMPPSSDIATLLGERWGVKLDRRTVSEYLNRMRRSHREQSA